jgi:hypothetical protein
MVAHKCVPEVVLKLVERVVCAAVVDLLSGFHQVTLHVTTSVYLLLLSLYSHSVLGKITIDNNCIAKI